MDVLKPHLLALIRTSSRSVTMDSNDEDLRLVLLLVCIYSRRRKRLSSQRSTWIRPIFERRRDQGDYHQLLQEMRLGDTESHFRFLRMSKERFDMLFVKGR